MNRTNLVPNGHHTPLSCAVRRALYQRGHRQAAVACTTAALVLNVVAAQADDAPATGAGSAEPALQEVLVTAEKRTESLQNVPYNISALDSKAIRDAGLESMTDITAQIPGLTAVDQGAAIRWGNNNFTLRGIRTDPPGGGSLGLSYANLTVSPVSTYWGETPVLFQMPLDDLERIEVLRGPQGTLYGSGAEAGTIRFIPKRPTFDKFSGEVRAEGSYTEYASGGNGNIHGVVNIPIADRLALRVVAGYDHLAGFIDAVNRPEVDSNGVFVPSIPGDLTSGFVLGPVQKGTNSSDQWFARGSLRWGPTEAIDLQLDYLHQHTSMADGQWGSNWPGGKYDTSFGAWPNATIVTRPGCDFCNTNFASEPYHDTIDLVDLVATFDLGLATLTSASSYYDDQNVSNFDGSGVFYGTATDPNASNYSPYYPYLSYPRVTNFFRNPPSTDSVFIQELRLASAPGKVFDYVVGLYYQNQHISDYNQQYIPGIISYLQYINMPNPSAYGDENYIRTSHINFVDKAIFGELTFHLTPAWQVTGGTRFFRQDYTSTTENLLPLCGAICSADQTNPNGYWLGTDSNDVSRHIWKVNTSYDLSSDLKLYATYSEGFRRGGVSGLPVVGPFASPADLQTFSPELAKNYEVGIKGTLLEHRIRYFADLFLVNLEDFQFDRTNLSAVIGAFNGKDARSEGFEFQWDMALTDRLTAGLGYSFTKSYVTTSFDIQDYPPYALIPSQGGTGQTASLFGGPLAAGTPLPGVSRNIANLNADYTLPAGSWNWQFHADLSYRSSQNSDLNPVSAYQFVIPSAFIANIRASLHSSNHTTYYAFIRNITNNPDVSGGINIQTYPNLYGLRSVGSPRTFGAGIQFDF